jgi:hypothetical protein
MGRPSLEADLLTRRYLEVLNHNLAIEGGREDWELPIAIEEYVGSIGGLGVGARLAIPRLEELCKYRNAWVRLWATEALGKVRPAKL